MAVVEIELLWPTPAWQEGRLRWPLPSEGAVNGGALPFYCWTVESSYLSPLMVGLEQRAAPPREHSCELDCLVLRMVKQVAP